MIGTFDESVDLVGENIANIRGADAGLLHRRGIDVDLHFSVASGTDIGLEAGRNDHDEHEPPMIHGCVDIGRLDELRMLETRRIEGSAQLFRQRRLILIDKGNRGPVHLGRRPLGLRIDSQRERVDYEDHQHGIRLQARNSLVPSQKILINCVTLQSSCLRNTRAVMASNAGMNNARANASAARMSKPNPLVNAPTLACM